MTINCMATGMANFVSVVDYPTMVVLIILDAVFSLHHKQT